MKRTSTEWANGRRFGGLGVTLFFLILFVAGTGRSAPRTRPGGDAMGRSPTRVGGGNAARERGELPTTAAVMHGPTRAGTAVYPEQSIPLRFNHGEHLGLGLRCLDCHESVGKSRQVADNNFPRGETCDRCHGDAHPNRAAANVVRCDLCHTQVEGQSRVTGSLRSPKPLLHFNHELHAKAGSNCEDCHGDMTKVRLATTLQLPREAQCLVCHDGVAETSRCGACHPTERGGRLVTRAIDDRSMPTLVPKGTSAWGIGHDLAFVEDHASVTKANPALCNTCHAEPFCLECHEGVVRPLRIHDADYVTTHALDARGRVQDCQSCHRTQSFCLGCHERLGFGDRDEGPFAVGGGSRFHPDDWSGPAGSPQGHAHAAQRNIAACSSCHREDSCLACHATIEAPIPGLGANPHGTGFRDSAKCLALEQRNRRVCLRCHAPGAPELDCR